MCVQGAEQAAGRVAPRHPGRAVDPEHVLVEANDALDGEAVAFRQVLRHRSTSAVSQHKIGALGERIL